jgi:hypothetical protein
MEAQEKINTIEINGIKYVREDSIQTNNLPAICMNELTGPWQIGKVYLIRTVTMIDTGVLVGIGEKELVLEEAAWIADTGRFSDAIARAEFNEVEPFPKGRVIINRACIIDAVEISKIPRSQK